MISVVIPTIDGREHWFERCLQAFTETSSPDVEYLVYRNFPTCGKAWNEGLREAQGDFILLAADDLEPHPGWWKPAIEVTHREQIPCPRILNSDGSLQSCGFDTKEVPTGTLSDVARVPFLPRRLADVLYPVFENQFMGDYWITWRAQQLGWQTIVVREMMFTHHMAMEGRLFTFEEDLKSFERVTS